MISRVVTHALAMTGSSRLMNSVYTRDGGGNRYSLIPVTRTASSQARNNSTNTMIAAPRLRTHATGADSRSASATAECAASLIAASRLYRVFRRGQVERAVLCWNIDLEELQIIGATDDVVRHAGGLRNAGTCRHDDVAVDAGKAKRQRAFEYEHKMRCHVVPMPAGRIRQRHDRAHVLDADPAVRRSREPQIAVFDVRPRAVARKLRIVAARKREGRERLRESERSGVSR